MALYKAPTLIEFGDLRFVISDAPSDSNVASYIKEYAKHNVSDIVRVCNPTYSARLVQEANLNLHDLPFTDGDSPPLDVIAKWKAIYQGVFAKNKERGEKNAVAVHCVAGLGRAPVLVALALMDAGMEPLDAVEFVRKRRKGAMNSKQISYLEEYKRHQKGKCAMM